MKIFIANTHSILNSGDAGIVLAQIQFLRKYFPSLQISLSSRTPELDKKTFHPLGVKIFHSIKKSSHTGDKTERPRGQQRWRLFLVAQEVPTGSDVFPKLSPHQTGCHF